MAPARPEPRTSSRLFLGLLALLAGAFGGLLANWPAIGASFGLLPPVEAPLIREIRREAFVEDSSTIDAIRRNAHSILGVTDPEGQVAGTALALSDDGLLLVVLLGDAPEAGLVAVSSSGYELPLEWTGADPWSGSRFARVSLSGVPALEIRPVTVSTEPPRLGQRLVALAWDGALRAEPVSIARIDGSFFPVREVQGDAWDAVQLEDWQVAPVLGAPPRAYVDLAGGFIGIGDPVVSGASLQTLLTTYQRTERFARPLFGFHAQERTLARSSLVAAESTGAEVLALREDGPYDRAGGLVGDVLTAVNGRALTTEYRLLDALIRQQPGQEVELSIRRGAERRTLLVMPDERR